MPAKNDLIEVTIDAYASDGSGIARADDLVIFVPRTVRGDRCVIRVVKVLKNMAYGRVEEVLDPSPERIEPFCPVFSTCGGCDFCHMTYEEEIRLKKERVEDALFRIGHISQKADAVHPAPERMHYRNKAQFPVGTDASGQPVTGFYRPRSHDIVPTAHCFIQSEVSNQAAQTVLDWVRAYKIPVYDEKTHSGMLRHILTRSTSSGDMLLTLVVTQRDLPHTDELIALVRSGCPSVSSLVLNLNRDPGNVILGKKDRILFGPGHVEETINGIVFQISSRSFFQINYIQACALYDKVLEYASETPRACAVDLYCGTGTITMLLAGKCREVTGVEIVDSAVLDAEKSAERNKIKNVSFFRGDASDAAASMARSGMTPDIVVVDPPRKGLDPNGIKAILEMSPERVIYVSCDPATLARDLDVFCSSSYELSRYEIYDMFPCSSHVETVVLLRKKRSMTKVMLIETQRNLSKD